MSNVSVKNVKKFTNPSIFHHHHPQHHQISQTIFLYVNKHFPSSDNHTHSNKEIIDISDDDEEEDENTCKNGTSIDDSSDEEEIEVIQLSDDDDDEDEVVNKESMKTKVKKGTENRGRGVFYGHVLKTLGLSCPECSVLVESRSKLEKHLAEAHADKMFFKCMIRGCERQFIKRKLLDKHYKDHNRNYRTKWSCSALNCKSESTTKASFVSHVKLYHEPGHFRCKVCQAQCSHRFMVYSHHHSKHKYPQERAHKLFSCTWPHCGAIFAKRTIAIMHVRTEHLDIPAHGNVPWNAEHYPWDFVEQIRINDMTRKSTIHQEEPRI